MQSNRWEGLWRNRRVPWLLLLLLVALAAIALWVFLDYQNTVAALAVKAEYNVTRLTAARIREELADFPNALIALARSPEMASSDPEAQKKVLQQSDLIQEGLFDGGIVVLNNFGSVVAAEPPRLEFMRQDWSARSYFRGLLSRPASSVVFSNAANEGPGGTPVIVVSVPIIEGKDRFVGVLVGMLRLSQSTISPYYATLVKMRVSPDGTAYLIDGSRKILFDSSSERNGQQYTNLPVPATPAADGIAAQRTVDAAGRELLVAHAPIPGTPWTLVTEKDWETLIAPVKSQSNLLFVLLGLAAILPLGTLVVLERQRHSPAGRDDLILSESHLAHQIEHALLPEQVPTLPGWDIAVHREAGLAAGRSFYDTVLGIDGCLTLIMGETNTRGVVGDTVPALLAMVAVRTLLRSNARSMLHPGEALEQANRALCPDASPGEFVPALYCRLNPANGALLIGNAGHIRPLKITTGASTGAVDLVGSQDPPLAMHLDCGYTESPVTLAPGDFLFLYSSGVVDARNGSGEPFGFTRLESALTAPVKEGMQRIQAVTGAVREFAGGTWAGERDAVLIVVERVQNGTLPAETPEV
jgi:hypothetical protein